MNTRIPHYLRFARTLALATTIALPACTDGDPADPPGEGGGGASSSADSTTTGAGAVSVASSSSGGGGGVGGAGGGATVTPPGEVDAGKISGPLPPPEMPAWLV